MQEVRYLPSYRRMSSSILITAKDIMGAARVHSNDSIKPVIVGYVVSDLCHSKALTGTATRAYSNDSMTHNVCPIAGV